MSTLQMHAPADLAFETTLLVRDTCLCLHTQRAARALARRFDRRMKMLPDRRRLGQNRPAGWRQPQQSGAPVRRIGRCIDEVTAL